MRRIVHLLIAVAVASMLLGCSQDSTGPSAAVTATDAGATNSEPDAPRTGTTETASEQIQDTTPDSSQPFPDVVDAVLTQQPDGTWAADVTVSSPYDGPDRYADAWRILTPDGEELALRILTHHHAGEQPFTRSMSGFTIPETADQVVVQARDLVNGWGGTELTIPVPR